MRKAQLEIMQTAFVVLIIIGLLAFSLIFIVLIQRSSAERKMQYFQALSEAKKSQVLKYLPELRCSFSNVPVSDCIDIQKAFLFREKVRENELFYRGILGNLLVRIESADKNLIKEGVVLYDASLQNSSIGHFEIPVLLYDGRSKKKSMGVMIVDSYYG